MTITAERAAATVEVDGTIYYFCSDRCRRKFEVQTNWSASLRERTQKSGSQNGCTSAAEAPAA